MALLDLSDEGALAIGATGTLQWGDEPRRRTRRWGRHIYEQYSHLEGIRYQAAHQSGECIVLWERAPTLQHLPDSDRKLWAVWSRVVTALAGQRRKQKRGPAAPGEARVYRSLVDALGSRPERKRRVPVQRCLLQRGCERIGGGASLGRQLRVSFRACRCDDGRRT
jgi:hypothetical protein